MYSLATHRLLVNKTLALIEVSKDDPSYQQTATQSSDLILRNQQYGMDVANMLAHQPPAQQIYLATVLSSAKVGWTPEMREKYFRLFNTFLTLKVAIVILDISTRRERDRWIMHQRNNLRIMIVFPGKAYLTVQEFIWHNTEVRAKGPGRSWTIEDALPVVAKFVRKRFRTRKRMFTAANCSSCHKMNGDGDLLDLICLNWARGFLKRIYLNQ